VRNGDKVLHCDYLDLMRVSRLMLVTLRDVPADAEIISHQLLLRGGFIRRVAAGVYAYLPMLWRVLQKISTIVREEMASVDALETLLPQLQPAELWQRSGRWSGYTAGEGIMFHLHDRQGRELGLGPTHEEVVTSLASDILRSYRQLPVCLYQIQTKFRDEIRPRFGLMRGREFIMKDAYSFHANEADLREYYTSMDGAYKRIFQRCGLQTVAVEADSGAIGGSASQEFMVTAEAGEDWVLTSSKGDYAANQERAIALAPDAVPLVGGARSGGYGDLFSTPSVSSIEELDRLHGYHPSQIVKVLLLLARFASGQHQPLLVCLRGDQSLNEVKLANAVSRRLAEEHGTLLGIEPLTAELVRQWGLTVDLGQVPFGSLGPDLPDATLVIPAQTLAGIGNASPAEGLQRIAGSFLRLVDTTAAELPSFVCGANQVDSHRVGVTWKGLGITPEPLDLRSAQSGDRCVHDPSQVLQATRGIEVGHIFQLGRKYSEALDASFTNEAGQEEPLWMGCYGIGISRLAQAAVEQHHDDAGIRWPVPIAPFEVIVVIANLQDQSQCALAETLYRQLQQAGLDVLLDDRPERAGVKFKDADLIGIPWRIVVGRGAADGLVELVDRGGDSGRQELAASAVVPTLLERIPSQRLGLQPG
jgi:prolyl-tRNA synthetase